MVMYAGKKVGFYRFSGERVLRFWGDGVRCLKFLAWCKGEVSVTEDGLVQPDNDKSNIR